MMRGAVSPEPEAGIPIQVRGPGGTVAVQAGVDTGFNDYLTLGPREIAALGLRAVGSAAATLAAGQVVEPDVFEGTVLWSGEENDVVIPSAEMPPLVGMALLYGHRVLLDVVEDGPLIIPPLP